MVFILVHHPKHYVEQGIHISPGKTWSISRVQRLAFVQYFNFMDLKNQSIKGNDKFRFYIFLPRTTLSYLFKTAIFR